MKTMTLLALLVMVLGVIRHSLLLARAGFSPAMQGQLARTPSGRVLLHLVCARRDHKFQWHGRGVVRELFRA